MSRDPRAEYNASHRSLAFRAGAAETITWPARQPTRAEKRRWRRRVSRARHSKNLWRTVTATGCIAAGPRLELPRIIHAPWRRETACDCGGYMAEDGTIAHDGLCDLCLVDLRDLCTVRVAS